MKPSQKGPIPPSACRSAGLRQLSKCGEMRVPKDSETYGESAHLFLPSTLTTPPGYCL